MTSLFPQGDEALASVARRFQMLGEPYRLRLLQSLEFGERTVGELVEALDGNQPNISKHLQMLHGAGLVNRRREGTSIYYTIADPMIITICEIVCRGAAEKAREALRQLNGTPASSKRAKDTPNARMARVLDARSHSG